MDKVPNATLEDEERFPDVACTFHKWMLKKGTMKEGTARSYVRSLASNFDCDGKSFLGMTTTTYFELVKASPRNKRGNGQLAASIRQLLEFWAEMGEKMWKNNGFDKADPKEKLYACKKPLMASNGAGAVATGPSETPAPAAQGGAAGAGAPSPPKTPGLPKAPPPAPPGGGAGTSDVSRPSANQTSMQKTSAPTATPGEARWEAKDASPEDKHEMSTLMPLFRKWLEKNQSKTEEVAKELSKNVYSIFKKTGKSIALLGSREFLNWLQGQSDARKLASAAALESLNCFGHFWVDTGRRLEGTLGAAAPAPAAAKPEKVKAEPQRAEPPAAAQQQQQASAAADVKEEPRKAAGVKEDLGGATGGGSGEQQAAAPPADAADMQATIAEDVKEFEALLKAEVEQEIQAKVKEESKEGKIAMSPERQKKKKHHHHRDEIAEALDEEPPAAGSDTEYPDVEVREWPAALVLDASGMAKLDGQYRRYARSSRGRPCYAKLGKKAMYLYWNKQWRVGLEFGSSKCLARTKEVSGAPLLPCEPYPYPWEVYRKTDAAGDDGSKQVWVVVHAMRAFDPAHQEDTPERMLEMLDIPTLLEPGVDVQPPTKKRRVEGASTNGFIHEDEDGGKAREDDDGSEAASSSSESDSEEEASESSSSESGSEEAGGSKSHQDQELLAAQFESKLRNVFGKNKANCRQKLYTLRGSNNDKSAWSGSQMQKLCGMTFEGFHELLMRLEKEYVGRVPQQPTGPPPKQPMGPPPKHLLSGTDSKKPKPPPGPPPGSEANMAPAIPRTPPEILEGGADIGGAREPEHRTMKPGHSVLKRRGERRFSLPRSLSYTEDSQYMLPSFKYLGEQLWVQQPGAHVFCDVCDRQVPQSVGCLQGAPNQSQFAQNQFVCRECIAQS